MTHYPIRVLALIGTYRTLAILIDGVSICLSIFIVNDLELRLTSILTKISIFLDTLVTRVLGPSTSSSDNYGIFHGTQQRNGCSTEENPWISVVYWEHGVQLGDRFMGVDSEIFVDGGCAAEFKTLD